MGHWLLLATHLGKQLLQKICPHVVANTLQPFALAAERVSRHTGQCNAARTPAGCSVAGDWSRAGVGGGGESVRSMVVSTIPSST